MLFTKNFTRCFINHLSHDDRYLHKVAKQVATDLHAHVQAHPQLGLGLVLQLTGVHGSSQFDKLTKTKTVESILTSMDAPGIDAYVDHVLAQFNTPTNEEGQSSRRTWAVDHLCALVRNGSIPKSDDWIQRVLDWLIVHGLYIVIRISEKSPIQAVSLHSCLCSRWCLTSIG